MTESEKALVDRMVFEAEKFRDEDKINELKCEVKNGLEKFHVAHFPREVHKSSKEVTNADENIPSNDDSEVKFATTGALKFHCFNKFLGIAK